MAKRAAGVTGKAHDIRGGRLGSLLVKLPLHAFVVLLLHLHAFFDPPLSLSKRPVLQLADQLGIEARLLGCNCIQVADTIHVILHSSHVQGGVVVIVQAPDVGTERHQEEKAVVVTVGSCQVERCVPPYVTLIGVPSVGDREDVQRF